MDARGESIMSPPQVNNGSSDACGITAPTPPKSTFNCANIGTNTVTLTVTDNNGNISTCTATITVAESVAPVTLFQGLTVQLYAPGHVTNTAEQANNGSSDVCGITCLLLDKTTFHYC